MREHEHSKILRDTQVYKDKCDEALIQLKHNEHEMQDLLAIREDCEEIQEREHTRLNKEKAEME